MGERNAQGADGGGPNVGFRGADAVRRMWGLGYQWVGAGARLMRWAAYKSRPVARGGEVCSSGSREEGELRQADMA